MATGRQPADQLEALRRVISDLYAEDPKVVARAAAAIFAFSNQKKPSPFLASVIPRLTALLGFEDILCQRNACAALTSIMSVDVTLYNLVVSAGGLVPSLIPLLSHEDVALRLNVSSALGEMSQGLPGVEAIWVSGGFSTVVNVMMRERDASVLESMVDIICTASMHKFERYKLIDAGAIEALSSILPCGFSEVQVRALLGLGMLIGSNSIAQEKLAKVKGSINSLLHLMRSEDKDIKDVAMDVFNSLASNDSLKETVELAIRDI